jgi:hypothetical protein
MLRDEGVSSYRRLGKIALWSLSIVSGPSWRPVSDIPQVRAANHPLRTKPRGRQSPRVDQRQDPAGCDLQFIGHVGCCQHGCVHAQILFVQSNESTPLYLAKITPSP